MTCLTSLPSTPSPIGAYERVEYWTFRIGHDDTTPFPCGLWFCFIHFIATLYIYISGDLDTPLVCNPALGERFNMFTTLYMSCSTRNSGLG